MSASVRPTLLLALPILLTLAGCPQPSTPENPEDLTTAPKLVPFASQAEMLAYVQARVRAEQQGRNGGWFGLLPGAAEDTSGDAPAGAEDDGAGDDYSTTNLQEAGVDESDVFKSDGTHFYLARGNSVRILRADPLAQLAEVGRIELESAVDSLYLYADTLIALGSSYGSYGYSGGTRDPAFDAEIWPPYYSSSEIVITQIDITDPAAPTVLHELTLDGALVSSWLTNGRLILVYTVTPDLPANPEEIALDDILPGARGASGATEPIPWDRWLHPLSPDGYHTTAVVTLDAAQIDTIIESVAVLANAGTIYASQEAVYLTNTEWDNDVQRETTTIHKLELAADGAARYAASGRVPGRPVNQFSLGEHAGYLRIATHVDSFAIFTDVVFPGLPEIAVATSAAGADDVADAPAGDASQDVAVAPDAPQNAVYVLGQVDDVLEIVGYVDGIAPNETMHAARFVGDHAFLVTYRQIDPLFVLDLSDPENPAVAGELVLPGFSDYLHPIDDTHLVGVGKATELTEEGFDWIQGVQLTLFDVSDWNAPSVVEQVTLGSRGSYSDVDYTHTAFTYMPATGLLALPVLLTEESAIPWEYGDVTFEGVVAFHVDPATGFDELGRLDAVHAADEYWASAWKRPAVIGDVLYAVSPAGVRAAPVTDLDAFSTLELEE